MNKELMAKVIEAGIVPAQAVKLMKRWQALPEDLPEGAKQEQTEDQLLELVREIATLLEETSELPEMKETMPDVARQFESLCQDMTFRIIRRDRRSYITVELQVMQDSMGCLILSQETWEEKAAAEVGNLVQKDDAWYQIMEVAPLYVAEDPLYMRCAIREVPNAALSYLREADEKPGSRESRRQPGVQELPEAERDQGEEDG